MSGSAVPRGESLEGRVRGIAREGDSVVVTERGLVFAPGGVPGDRVRLEDVRRERKLLHARRLVVLEPSPERVEAPCLVVDRCGGCPWMSVSARVQGDAKRETVERALARVSQVPEVSITITMPDARLAYRRRARLAWMRTRDGTVLGFRARRSDTIVDVDRCVVLRAPLDDALAPLRARLAPHLPGSGEMHLGLGHGERPVIALETAAAPSRALFEVLDALIADGVLAGATVRAGGSSVATAMGDARELGPDVEGRSLHGAVGGFSQAHEEINAKLGARVVALADAEGKRVLELFAGHGNLTLALAARASHVLAVELSKPATDALRINLATHGLTGRVEVITVDASRAIPKKGFEVVVLDPPRAGAKEAIEAIAALAPERVVYVSCDPATLGRDLEQLAEHGYVLDAAEAFDMFPQTGHVETVARMIRVR